MSCLGKTTRHTANTTSHLTVYNNVQMLINQKTNNMHTEGSMNNKILHSSLQQLLMVYPMMLSAAQHTKS